MTSHIAYVQPTDSTSTDTADCAQRGAHSDSIPVFRAVPATVTEIRDGDWIALDWAYCASHADAMAEWQGVPWHVIEMRVPEAEAIWAGPDLDEWYDDEGEKREFFWKRAR